MPPVSAAPEFTDRDVRLIAGCFPDGVVDQWRLELLPMILREWSHTDLREYSSMSPRAVIRNRLQLLKTVENRASDLLQALNAIDMRDRFRIAAAMARAEGRTTEFAAEWKVWLDKDRDFLTRLAAAALATLPKPGRGRPRNSAASLVMADVAAIFEWLTNTKATRQVDRIEHKETGPFWDFAAAVWPVVFRKGTVYLPAAMKNWADLHEVSGLIVTIDLNHPAWGIFRK